MKKIPVSVDYMEIPVDRPRKDWKKVFAVVWLIVVGLVTLAFLLFAFGLFIASFTTSPEMRANGVLFLIYLSAVGLVSLTSWAIKKVGLF